MEQTSTILATFEKKVAALYPSRPMSLEQEDAAAAADAQAEAAASLTKDEALEQKALDQTPWYVKAPAGVKVMANYDGDAQKGSTTLPIGARVVFADAPAEGMFDFNAKKRLEQNNMG